MPFVTEENAAALPGGDGALLLGSRYPAPGPALDAADAREMDLLVELVSKIRQVRGELGLPPASRLSVALPTAATAFAARHGAAIAALARTAAPALSDDPPSPTATTMM